ncbi:MAG: ABC transporter ATP-binding protein [Bacteroidales bacterium]|nr:ABC transporter ATP-binding protein [Bacteroidales bacterium]
MATAIEFDHVGKQYRLGLISTKTLSHDLNRWWRTAILKQDDPYLRIGEVNDRTTAANHSQYVWALRDIDFKVEQGDVVGIIGKNGAGKSTLLKLLSKVTGPTVGTIRARGRIGALLEVGTGFHPEMTGRENIYMNGAIMGMTKAEVARKLDEIIDFSGCERYIDTPVKRYSSGMTVRLGFAVAAHLDPEILVVDEVLAVGDAEFQKKAIGKMKEVSHGEGRTVLFVSHNMASIKKLCRNGILLRNGQIAYQGSVSDTIATYLSYTDNEGVDCLETKTNVINNSIRINSVAFDGKENSVLKFIGNEQKTIRFSIKGEVDICMNVSVEVFLYDSNETIVATYSPTHWNGRVEHLEPGIFEIQEAFDLPDMLTSGEYSLSIALSQMNIEQLVRIDNATLIKIEEFASPYTSNVFWQSYYGCLIMRPHDE